MKQINWEIYIASALVVLAAFFLLLHYYIFRDLHNIFYYLLLDVAFMFIQVLLVTLIIHRLLNDKEKRGRLEKLNMVIGAFFSETGKELMFKLAAADPHFADIREELVVKDDWSNKHFLEARKKLKDYSFSLMIEKTDIIRFKEFLHCNRNFLLRIIENPTLLEHETFTDLLLSLFHLTEELEDRKDVSTLSKADSAHLSHDMSRVYQFLIYEWLEYTRYLKYNYPYLFSLAVRTNPINPNAKVEID